MNKGIYVSAFCFAMSLMKPLMAYVDIADVNQIIQEKPKDTGPNVQFTFKEDTHQKIIPPKAENSLVADYAFWPKTPSYLYLRDKSVADAVRDFCKMQDVDVVLSAAIQKKQQKVHQSFENKYPAEIWDQLVKSCSLLWFFDGHALFVYDSSEVETKILKVHPHQIDPLLDLIKKLGFVSSNMGINPMREGGIIIVSGTPKMIQLLGDMTSSMQFYNNKEMGVLGVRVFPLKHAWADDKTIGSLTIPGIATMLKDILGKTSNEKFATSPTNNDSAQKIKSIKQQTKDTSKEDKPKDKRGLPEGGLITTDIRQNAIIVKDYSHNLPLYEDIITKLDVPLELIEIQAVIVSVNKNCGLTVGLNSLNFSAAGNNRSIEFQPIGEALSDKNNFTLQWKGIVRGSEFLTAINVLESQNHSKILARPSVITMNNLTAVMNQSETYYFPVQGARGGDLYSIKGSTKLQVTPHLVTQQNGKRQIQLILDIADEKVTPGEKENKSKIKSSTISTQAIVYEGQSVLVGGYFSEQFMDGHAGVPVLKNLPIFGNFFKNKTKNQGVSEHLFLITPKIIRLSAGQDRYEGLFKTPSNLLAPHERVDMHYLTGNDQPIEKMTDKKCLKRSKRLRSKKL